MTVKVKNEKELFLQGFFSGLRHIAELPLRSHVEELDIEAESALTS